MNQYVVVSYFTVGTLYEQHAQTLLASLRVHGVPHDVVGVPNLGDWYKNTCYKPTFLKLMLVKHAPASVVWVDCDAVFTRYPALFDTFEGDVGVHVFDRSCYAYSAGGTEVLSGTVWLRNTDAAFALVEAWERECRANPREWDQRSLEKVLCGHFAKLPGEYCKIFDREPHVKDPVIVHHQASRTVRKNHGKLS